MPRFSEETRERLRKKHITPPKNKRWTDDMVEYLKTKIEEGYTLQELGKEFGVSDERIRQVIGGSTNLRNRTLKSHQYSIYPNIDKWMHDHNMTYLRFAIEMGFGGNTETAKRLANCLSGRNEFNKTAIDRLLKATGFTYEEAFKI